MSGTPTQLHEADVIEHGRSSKRRTPHVIAITSGKGGVGKTNFTANLAWQLRQLRRRVMILDADLGLANIDIVLGLAPQYNISHVLAGEKRLSEILVKGPAGIQILPASSGVLGTSDITEQQKIMLLQQMEELESSFDFLLIDTGAGIGGNVVYFALAAQTIVVVLTPEPTSLADAYALIKVLSTNYRQNSFKVLVNEAASEHEGLDVFRRLTTVTDRFLNVSVDFVGYLPRDVKVREAVRAQRPFAEMFPTSAASQALKRVTRQVLTLENDPMKSDLGLLWRNLFLTPAA
jgi:flagellar biosynthesis protein FlhG